MQSIILASKSPRRKQLLEWAEIPFEIITEDTEESFPAELKIEDVPVFIAKKKVLAVAADYPQQIVLAADTIVAIDNEVIGKPKDKEEARETLQKLSGKTHRVITGVAIQLGEKEISFSDITEVTFHKLSWEQINFYVEKYQPYDKAGAYAIQEWIGVIGIKCIKGDFYNVMGLPVSRVAQELQRF
ncbi:Maf family protein [Arachidicoccus soli]|uniref:dTTP/UTP pyrophosphatase n=1 Tax=Arachidicoccus soli TaxID=2341117 RepID=A0A386HLE3_9BACT|nr:Maf family nucleotide pyrophosphatase [Arachidicoccus soli]AYD46717.1 septum formation protein Maf [Arachidicoccus soli]